MLTSFPSIQCSGVSVLRELFWCQAINKLPLHWLAAVKSRFTFFQKSGLGGILFLLLDPVSGLTTKKSWEIMT